MTSPSPRFLIIEDHPEVSQNNCEFLRMMEPDCSCIIVDTPRKGIENLNQQVPDLVVVDLQFGTLTGEASAKPGLELLKQIFEKHPTVNVLVYTSEPSYLRQVLKQIFEHQAGDLTIQVHQYLQPLREPKSDSLWIDAREDIFRFFREAMANVIRHAQPPNGTATKVSIYLSQEGPKCRLVIENNGILPTTDEKDNSDKKRQMGGYGTKIMATIASELPQGTWERLSLETGEMRVSLTWTIETI